MANPIKHEFYDVKLKKKVQATVTEKIQYGKRYAFRGVTADKRPLTAFISKAAFDAAKI